jgi:molybdopterin adenylyltransferase
MIRVGVLTISDKGAAGLRVDVSGQVIKDTVAAAFGEVTRYDIIPDEAPLIAKKLRDWADEGRIDVILTTGGTGLGPRDVTPEATLSVIDKEVPGLAEIMRVKTFEKTPMSVLSRAVAGVRQKCLIINMPGNPRAVREDLDIIMPAIRHGVEIITGAYTEHPPEHSEKRL